MGLTPGLNPLDVIGAAEVVRIVRSGCPIAMIGPVPGLLAGRFRAGVLTVVAAGVGLVQLPALTAFAFTESFHAPAWRQHHAWRQTKKVNRLFEREEEDGRTYQKMNRIEEKTKENLPLSNRQFQTIFISASTSWDRRSTVLPTNQGFRHHLYR